MELIHIGFSRSISRRLHPTFLWVRVPTFQFLVEACILISSARMKPPYLSFYPLSFYPFQGGWDYFLLQAISIFHFVFASAWHISSPWSHSLVNCAHFWSSLSSLCFSPILLTNWLFLDSSDLSKSLTFSCSSSPVLSPPYKLSHSPWQPFCLGTSHSIFCTSCILSLLINQGHESALSSHYSAPWLRTIRCDMESSQSRNSIYYCEHQFI